MPTRIYTLLFYLILNCKEVRLYIIEWFIFLSQYWIVLSFCILLKVKNANVFDFSIQNNININRMKFQDVFSEQNVHKSLWRIYIYAISFWSCRLWSVTRLSTVCIFLFVTCHLQEVTTLNKSSCLERILHRIVDTSVARDASTKLFGHALVKKRLILIFPALYRSLFL